MVTYSYGGNRESVVPDMYDASKKALTQHKQHTPLVILPEPKTSYMIVKDYKTSSKFIISPHIIMTVTHTFHLTKHDEHYPPIAKVSGSTNKLNKTYKI